MCLVAGRRYNTSPLGLILNFYWSKCIFSLLVWIVRDDWRSDSCSRLWSLLFFLLFFPQKRSLICFSNSLIAENFLLPPATPCSLLALLTPSYFFLPHHISSYSLLLLVTPSHFLLLLTTSYFKQRSTLRIYKYSAWTRRHGNGLD